jgi:hypothetical protein
MKEAQGSYMMVMDQLFHFGHFFLCIIYKNGRHEQLPNLLP